MTAPVTRAVEVRGVVQGVGFRPFVWRLAHRYDLRGWVRNRSGVVEILAEGPEEAVAGFCAALSTEAPPMARVESVRVEPAQPDGAAGFEVDVSLDGVGVGVDGGRSGEAGERLVSPDVATCLACLRELFDPEDRRYRYPFINCTDCGPRFTIIESLPYDRERTSMRAFPMCADCAREYADPEDRRFHAEPVACPACGPRLWLEQPAGGATTGDAIAEAAGLLRSGAIVAIKGLGGFHLACDATSERAVGELRRRKRRPSKPLAVMTDGLESARGLFELGPAEEAALTSWQAPIVLVRAHAPLAPAVAPGHLRHGAMLPSTPLHHLLVREAGLPLVMTSGNRSEEPICTGNDEARQRLAGVADAFLLHDRDIVSRYDDSVVRSWRGAPVLVRRARSYAPSPLDLPADVVPTLGCGAELHATFTLAVGRRAFVSQHVGDLVDEESMAAYEQALNRYRHVFGIEPERVAHDLHPDFATTRFAQSTGLPSVAVQHHHAHVAAVMAEHGLTGQVIGVAFDGFGLGEDGSAWGGEFLVADWERADRLAHLRTVRLPGGDAAVRNPVRMAIAHAADAGVLPAARKLIGSSAIDDRELGVVLGQIESGLASPMTSSAGRLFDAVAALAGVCRRATYEGQPAILLEQAAHQSATAEYPYEFSTNAGMFEVDTRPLIAAVVRDLGRRRAPGAVAGRFQRTMAAIVVEVCRVLRGQTGLDRVCLSGGVFHNDMLLSDTVARLESCGFKAFAPREVPPGDGGISLGQVLVAHARLGGA